MKRFMRLIATVAVLAHCLSSNCNAVNYVQDPTTAGLINTTQNIQCSGGATTGGNKIIDWTDGSGVIVKSITVGTAPMSPFSWAGQFSFPTIQGNNTWAVGTGKCQMRLGGTFTTPTIQ